MTRPQPPRTDGVDMVLVSILTVLATAAAGQWLAGNAAALLGRGRLLHATPVQALASLTRLPHHLRDPRGAWPAAAAGNLPGPVLYWLATVVAASALAAVVLGVLGVVGGRRHEPADKRRRLGIPTQARLAHTRDLRPLLTR